MDPMKRFPTPRASLSALCLGLCALPAVASMNLALDKGCLSCHGTPPRGQAPQFGQIAADYEKYRGQETDILRLSRALCAHHMLGGVSAHERLSAEDAERFVRWLVDGGK